MKYYYWLLAIGWSFFVSPFVAQAQRKTDVRSWLETAREWAGLPSGMPLDFIGPALKAALGLVGVIFFCMGLYGGYLWMTAMGNTEKVDKAKETVTHAIIGFIIILAAYGIVTYIVYTIKNVVSSK